MEYKVFFNDDIEVALNAKTEGKEKEFLEAFIGILEYDPEVGEIPDGMDKNWYFNFYRRRVDKSYEKNLKRITANRNNGVKGGRPKKNKDTVWQKTV